MKFLITDSGATKTDWLFVDGTETIQIQTQGLHPATIEKNGDLQDLKGSVGALQPDRIFFFGTGCGNFASDEKVRRLLLELFPESEIHIASDLDGSARAFFHQTDGTVVILGTGAVCAKIEKGKVVQKSAALGYAIGDEGSAADLGRRLLRIYYRGEGSAEVVEFIKHKLNGTDYPAMMDRIYTAAKPNRELASIAGEVLQKPYPGELNEMVRQAFQDFIDHQLNALDIPKAGRITATGKVAQIHQDLLLSVLKENGYKNAGVRYPVIETFRNKILSSEIVL